MSLLSLIALTSPEARACGGFACSAARPVLQNAERIVFGLDPEENEVEMHVQITYTGPSNDFSWIVPVPGEPDLFITSSALFNRLAIATQPVFKLNPVDDGFCTDEIDLSLGVEYSIESAAPKADMGYANSTVSVVSEQAVGPYETVTLQAQSADGLLTWLTDNGYDIPSNFDAVLAPYIAQDAYFVALKLRKDQDVGDLAPLGLRYPATKAMVPVQLTSVSATPDMRMEAYILSDTRAVPESYYHVRINDAAIDWWQQGSNYSDVITVAANEAGGHAFATDYYGDTDLINPLWNASAYHPANLRQAGSPQAWINELRSFINVPSPELYTALEELLGLDTGFGQTAWACPDCVTARQFDAETATAAIEERVIDPIRVAQRLLDRYPKLSRMTSSLDAIEMTVDPIFVLNPDMNEGVSRIHNADLVFHCRNGKARNKSDRSLELADGRSINLPSMKWMEEHTMSDFQYIEELGDRKAQIIEQTGASGPPEIIADFTGELFDQVAAFNGLAGCGCDQGAGAGSIAGVGVLGGLLGMMVRRRRG